MCVLYTLVMVTNNVSSTTSEATVTRLNLLFQSESAKLWTIGLLKKGEKTNFDQNWVFFGLDSQIISPKIQRIILQKEIATFQRGCFEITYLRLGKNNYIFTTKLSFVNCTHLRLMMMHEVWKKNLKRKIKKKVLNKNQLFLSILTSLELLEIKKHL